MASVSAHEFAAACNRLITCFSAESAAFVSTGGTPCTCRADVAVEVGQTYLRVAFEPRDTHSLRLTLLVDFDATYAVPRLFLTLCHVDSGEPASLSDWDASVGAGAVDRGTLRLSHDWHPLTRTPGLSVHGCDTAALLHTLMIAEGAESHPAATVLAFILAHLHALQLTLEPHAASRMMRACRG